MATTTGGKTLRPAAIITRFRVLRSPLATGWGPAWKYHYNVVGPEGAEICMGTDCLAHARWMARRAGLATRETWKGGT